MSGDFDIKKKHRAGGTAVAPPTRAKAIVVPEQGVQARHHVPMGVTPSSFTTI